jgi:hypothetical protein
MEAWEQAERIRRYTNALVEKAAGQGPILPESDLAKWIAWAGRYADRIDPLTGKIEAERRNFGNEHATSNTVRPEKIIAVHVELRDGKEARERAV